MIDKVVRTRLGLLRLVDTFVKVVIPNGYSDYF